MLGTAEGWTRVPFTFCDPLLSYLYLSLGVYIGTFREVGSQNELDLPTLPFKDSLPKDPAASAVARIWGSAGFTAG